jgi:hypothetical protein
MTHFLAIIIILTSTHEFIKKQMASAEVQILKMMFQVEALHIVWRSNQ